MTLYIFWKYDSRCCWEWALKQQVLDKYPKRVSKTILEYVENNSVCFKIRSHTYFQGLLSSHEFHFIMFLSNIHNILK